MPLPHNMHIQTVDMMGSAADGPWAKKKKNPHDMEAQTIPCMSGSGERYTTFNRKGGNRKKTQKTSSLKYLQPIMWGPLQLLIRGIVNGQIGVYVAVLLFLLLHVVQRFEFGFMNIEFKR